MTRALATTREQVRARPASPAERPRARRPRPRAGRSERRLLRSALLLLAVTWLPGIVGEALGFPLLRSWGLAAAYSGLAWAVPALLVGVAVTRAAAASRRAHATLEGACIGVAVALALLLVVAATIGN